MPIKSEKELSEALRSHWLKAVAAIELRNFDYAISLLQGILRQEPEFLTGRQLLRRAEVTKQRAAKKAFFNVTTAEIDNNDGGMDASDEEAIRLDKDAAERAAMKTGGWTQAESCRDLIKDKGVAVSLEQQSRMALTGESLDQQIEEAYARHEAEPQSVDLARRLGALYEQKEDIENAIAWYQYSSDLTKGTDANVVRKAADLRRKQADDEIAAHEKFLAEHDPGTPDYATRSEALVQAKKQRAELSIEEARKRSERNPTDLQLRFELGERLIDAGRPREALPELQRARQNPNARLKSMNLLGRCYRDLGMLDLAAKQLEEGAKEITSMDAMKKEIVYNLGLVYEQMGETEKSIAAMKQIYEADYGYRDVAARVESSYERKPRNR